MYTIVFVDFFAVEITFWCLRSVDRYTFCGQGSKASKGGQGVFLQKLKNFLIGSVAVAAGRLSMFVYSSNSVWGREAIFSNSK